jgi:uncharacterized protein YbbK (DUF523 family)/uncharacterized protein YbgA (DUF1722 family)
MIGVSACLVGRLVRYDGGHRQDDLITTILARHFILVEVCPEVETNMGVPRPTLNQVLHGHGLRLVQTSTGHDHTEMMQSYGANKLLELKKLGIVGHITKKGSPSCGLSRSPIYDKQGHLLEHGAGIFVRYIHQMWPSLPLVTECGLQNEDEMYFFLQRVFAQNRLKIFFAKSWTIAQLHDLHKRERALTLSHDPARAMVLDNLLTQAENMNAENLSDAYMFHHSQCLSKTPTPQSHRLALQQTIEHSHAYEFRQADTAAAYGALDNLRQGRLSNADAMRRITTSIGLKIQLPVANRPTYLYPNPKHLQLLADIRRHKLKCMPAQA